MVQKHVRIPIDYVIICSVFIFGPQHEEMYLRTIFLSIRQHFFFECRMLVESQYSL